jgi:hypothetical protein
MTEAQFTTAVLGLMRVLGWRSMHVRPARTAAGSWRTPIAGDGIGWPDVVAVKDDRLVAAELKVAGGRLGPGQREWLAALAAAGCEVYVWTPKSWREIEDVLKGQLELGGGA